MPLNKRQRLIIMIFWSRLAGFIPSQQRLLCSFAGFLCP
jgi:hypothetical protein